MNKKNYTWKRQSLAENHVEIDCPVYDPDRDFRRDPSGCYVLIRPNLDTKMIEVAICDKDHKIVAIFRGAKCQDLYESIFMHEKKHNLTWFESKGHIAYLGKELKKAELAIAAGQNNYFQE